MTGYEEQAQENLRRWQRKMLKRQSMTGRTQKKWQTKMNTMIPEKVHTAISTGIKNMVHATLVGSEYTTNIKPLHSLSLEEREKKG